MQWDYGEDDLRIALCGVSDLPLHAAAAVAGFDLRILVKPSAGAATKNCRREASQNVWFSEQPQEWPIAGQYHAIGLRLAVQGAIVETGPVIAHNCAVLRTVSQLGRLEVGEVFHLARLAPGDFRVH